jgi:deleted-in-malignant-brain-tumors protein 1
MVDIASQNRSAALATVFSAIVASEGDSDIVQFEVSATDGVIALINGEQVDFTVVEQEFKGVVVTDLGNNTLSSTFSSGAYLEIQEENNILSSMVVSLPESYKDVSTQGLLGTFNGNTSDDLQAKFGENPLSLGSTLQEIHYHFGLTWIIDTPRGSLFSYPPDETWEIYYSPSFQPVFQPQFEDVETEMEANTLCGDDIFCLFDIAATGNTELGLSTLRTSQEIAELEKLSLPIICDPPCQNGACVGNNTCACSQGFIGNTCAQKVLMECERNPCENGGTCTRHVSDYTCTCPPTYTGYLCEVREPGDESDNTVVIAAGTTAAGVAALSGMGCCTAAIVLCRTKRRKKSDETAVHKEESNMGMKVCDMGMKESEMGTED